MTTTKTPSGEYSGLGYYIREVLFDEFKQERLDHELKWEKNLNSFKAITGKPWKKDEGKDWRSTTHIQSVKQKVVVAYAMVIDMLLQGGKFPFALVASPMDEVEFEDLPDDEREATQDSIDDGKKLIDQQLTDCNADRQLMKNVMSAAIYGETYAEKYVHTVTRIKHVKVMMAPEGTPNPEQYVRWEKVSEEKNAPAYQYVSLWNIFRDLESEDLQLGRGYVKSELTSPYELQQLKDGPFYLNDKIDLAIEHAAEPGGSQHSGDEDGKLPPGMRDIEHRSKTIQKLTFWGRVPESLVKDFESEVLKKGGDSFDTLADIEHDGNEVELMVVMADMEVIQYAINDMGERPLYRVVWEDKLDHSDATGVADNVQDIGDVLNGMVRGLEDNIKLIANVMIAVKKRYLAPGALKDFTPGKEIEIAEECDDARKAVQQIIIQDITGSLIQGIPLFERYADEASQMPKIMQGVVAEKHKPDTLGEMNILQQNAGKYLGAVIKNFDEGLIEPVTMGFYDYNMEDPEVTKGKGNFITQALGFSSFQNSVMRMQKLMQGLNLVLSNEVLTADVKPREILQDLWKALDLDPTTVFKTTEEKKEEFEQQMEMRAQEEARVRQIQTQMAQDEAQVEIGKEEAKHEMEGEIKEQEHEHDIEDAQLEHEHDKIEAEQKFEYDLVLKSVDTKQRAAGGQ